MMDSAGKQQISAPSSPTPQIVGNAFVTQYYHILHQSPGLVYRFYQDTSKLGRPEENGTLSSVTTLDAINRKILSLEYGEFGAEIKTVDAQDSYDGAVLVLVTGYLTGRDNVKRNFTQTFFLAPQDKGYFVLNDMFRYVDSDPDKSQSLAVEVEAPPTPDEEPTAVQQIPVSENHVPEQITPPSPEEVSEEEVHIPSENREVDAVEEEPPVPEVVDEIQDDSLVTDSCSKIEDVPKKSYASIVKVAPSSATVSTPPRSAPREPQLSGPPPPAPLLEEVPIENPNAMVNGYIQEGEAEGYSIYIKSLPMSATPALLEAEFKNFGPIKSNGIQVRSQKGFCFGFVEFEVASAVQSAIKASPILIGGREAYVEEKRSISRGNRGRYQGGRGGNGFRNDGARGRGNYGGGRSYGRGDYGNRSDFGNRNGARGGYPTRGGDGFQKVDHMGSNSGGGRMNRAGGVTANGTVKNRQENGH